MRSTRPPMAWIVPLDRFVIGVPRSRVMLRTRDNRSSLERGERTESVDLTERDDPRSDRCWVEMRSVTDSRDLLRLSLGRMVTTRSCVRSELDRDSIRFPMRELGRSVVRLIVEDRVSLEDPFDGSRGTVLGLRIVELFDWLDGDDGLMMVMRFSREFAFDRLELRDVVGAERVDGTDGVDGLIRSVGRLEDVFCLGETFERDARLDCAMTDRVERLDGGTIDRVERFEGGVTERLGRDVADRVERVDRELIDGVAPELRLREVELRTRCVEDDPDDRLCRLGAGDDL